MTLIKNVSSTPATNVVIRNEASFVECFFSALLFLINELRPGHLFPIFQTARHFDAPVFCRFAYLECLMILDVFFLLMINKYVLMHNILCPEATSIAA